MEESEEISFSDVVPHHDFNLNQNEDGHVIDDGENEDGNDSSKMHFEMEQAGEVGDENSNDVEVDNVMDMELNASPTKKTRRLKSEVKRCTSKWILFSAEMRPRIVEEFPEYTFPEIARTIAERYRNISAHDSERLDEMVRLDKERYKMEIAEAEDDLPGNLMSGKKADDQAALPTSTLAFPMSKVRKACKLDPEVKAISKDAVPLITKAVELFVGFLARKVAYTVSLRGVRSIREADLIQTIYMHESLEFMRIDFPRKPLANTSIPKNPSVRHEIVPKHRVSTHKSLDTGSTVGVKAKADRLAPQPAAGKSIAKFFGSGAGTSTAAPVQAPIQQTAAADEVLEERVVDNDVVEGGDEVGMDEAANTGSDAEE